LKTPRIQDQSESLRKLYESALQARNNSYSPYSGHKVGAAIRTMDGKIHSGCNVENSSYGGTVCAERTAIFKAVSETGKIRIEEVVVITDSPEPWPPCGFCRQILSEFASPDLQVHAVNLQGTMRTSRFSELFPEAFTPDYLGKCPEK
jgi:cytidine deaminase